MTTTITSRVSGLITADNTQRVAHNGEVAGATFEAWGDAWGDAWGTTWLNTSVATAASPAIDTTARVSGVVTANNTKRVSL